MRQDAVPRVLSAGDQAYSNYPEHAEGDHVEDRFLESELHQQAKLAEVQQAASKGIRTEAVHMPTATHAVTVDRVSQVRGHLDSVFLY